MAGGGSDESGDILMRMVGPNGPLPGESQTHLLAPGRSKILMDGFTQGFAFEVDSFTFSVNVDDDTGASDDKKDKKKETKEDKRKPKKRETNFKAWRGNSNHKYPVAIQPVEIKRAMDTTSALLLEHFIKCTTFEKATLVKLKPAGGIASGEAYLRVDFSWLLLQDANWSNDEPVQTSYKFISRKVLVQYRPQLPDGTLGAPLSAFWSVDPRDYGG